MSSCKISCSRFGRLEVRPEREFTSYKIYDTFDGNIYLDEWCPVTFRGFLEGKGDADDDFSNKTSYINLPNKNESNLSNNFTRFF